MKKQTLLDRLRLWPWLAAAILTTIIVGLIAPYQLGVLIWSLSKLCLGAYLGYWIDRSIFSYARPGGLIREGSLRIACLCMLRRALIIAAAVLALGLGV